MKMFGALWSRFNKPFKKAPNGPRRPSAPRRRTILELEALEQRQLLSAVSVLLHNVTNPGPPGAFGSVNELLIQGADKNASVTVTEMSGTVIVDADSPGEIHVHSELARNQVGLIKFVGGAADNVFQNNTGIDCIARSGLGNNDLYGGTGRNWLTGVLGHGTLHAGTGTNFLDGGAGFQLDKGRGLNFDARQWAIDGATFDDINQQSLNACGFYSTLAAVSLSGADLASRIAYRGDWQYDVQLFKDGRPVQQRVSFDVSSDWKQGVLTNDEFPNVYRTDGTVSPFDPTNLAGAGSGSAEFWVQLYRKAFLNLVGSGDPIETFGPHGFYFAGTSLDALTGQGHERHGSSDVSIQQINDALNQGRPMVAVIWAGQDIFRGPSTPRLDSWHAYTLIGTGRDPVSGEDMIVLRNPWGEDGHDSHGLEASGPNANNDDGIVSITMRDFAASMHDCYIGAAGSGKNDVLVNMNYLDEGTSGHATLQVSQSSVILPQFQAPLDPAHPHRHTIQVQLNGAVEISIDGQVVRRLASGSVNSLTIRGKSGDSDTVRIVGGLPMPVNVEHGSGIDHLVVVPFASEAVTNDHLMVVAAPGAAPTPSTDTGVVTLGGQPINYIGISDVKIDAPGARVASVRPSRTGIRVTFNKPIADTLAQAQVTLTGPSGPIGISAINPVAGSDNTTFDIVFQNPVHTTYRLVIGPNILDRVGNAMDQNGNGVNGEAGDAEVFDMAAPVVTSTAPSWHLIHVTFSKPIDAGTFTADKVVIRETNGHIVHVSDIRPSSGINGFDVMIDGFTAKGYTMSFLSGITDTLGIAMDPWNTLPYSDTTPPVVNLIVERVWHGITLEFNEPVDPTTVMAAVRIDRLTNAGSTRTSMAIQVSPLAYWDSRDFDIRFQADPGNYELTVLPTVKDVFGNQMVGVDRCTFNLDLPADPQLHPFKPLDPRLDAAAARGYGNLFTPASLQAKPLSDNVNTPADWAKTATVEAWPKGTMTSDSPKAKPLSENVNTLAASAKTSTVETSVKDTTISRIVEAAFGGRAELFGLGRQRGLL